MLLREPISPILMQFLRYTADYIDSLGVFVLGEKSFTCTRNFFECDPWFIESCAVLVKELQTPIIFNKCQLNSLPEESAIALIAITNFANVEVILNRPTIKVGKHRTRKNLQRFERELRRTRTFSLLSPDAILTISYMGVFTD